MCLHYYLGTHWSWASIFKYIFHTVYTLYQVYIAYFVYACKRTYKRYPDWAKHIHCIGYEDRAWGYTFTWGIPRLPRERPENTLDVDSARVHGTPFFGCAFCTLKRYVQAAVGESGERVYIQSRIGHFLGLSTARLSKMKRPSWRLSLSIVIDAKMIELFVCIRIYSSMYLFNS